MIVDADKYEGFITAMGSGAFGELEYDGPLKIILRSSVIKTAEVSGAVRVYFDNKRNEVMTGRRFEPMGMWFLRAGTAYKVYTTISSIEPVPLGVVMKIQLTEDARDVMMLADDIARVDSDGILSFIVIPFRRIEMESMTSIARLVFCEPKWESKKSVEKKAPVSKSIKKVGKSEGHIPHKHTNIAKT